MTLLVLQADIWIWWFSYPSFNGRTWNKLKPNNENERRKQLGLKYPIQQVCSKICILQYLLGLGDNRSWRANSAFTSALSEPWQRNQQDSWDLQQQQQDTQRMGFEEEKPVPLGQRWMTEKNPTNILKLEEIQLSSSPCASHNCFMPLQGVLRSSWWGE